MDCIWFNCSYRNKNVNDGKRPTNIMKRSELIKAIQEVLAEKKRPGLWANINAKRKRGEKPSHGNSNAHKDAVAAGNAMKK